MFDDSVKGYQRMVDTVPLEYFYAISFTDRSYQF